MAKSKKRRIKWVGKVVYGNGFFRSGIVKNNRPKHDVIVIQFHKEKKTPKTISIDEEQWELTADEAMNLNFLLAKAILCYVLNSRHDIRLWEHKNALRTIRIIGNRK